MLCSFVILKNYSKYFFYPQSKKKKKKRHRSSSRSDYSLEEGEWSGSSGSEKEKETDNSVTVNIDKNDEEYTATNEVLSANESDLDMLLQPQKKQRTLSVDGMPYFISV